MNCEIKYTKAERKVFYRKKFYYTEFERKRKESVFNKNSGKNARTGHVACHVIYRLVPLVHHKELRTLHQSYNYSLIRIEKGKNRAKHFGEENGAKAK